MKTSLAPTAAVLLAFAGSSHTLALDAACLNGISGFVLKGINSSDNCGWEVSSAGDINGDGVDDIVISAFMADPKGMKDAGESYIVFGGSEVGAEGEFELDSLDGTNGFRFEGLSAGDRCGFGAALAGDINGDGIGDLVIGALDASPNGNLSSGESYVIFGHAEIGSSGSFDLASLNGANGFSVAGLNRGDHSGYEVSTVGDLNDDGIDDLVIGATNADPNGESSAGEAYVIFGSAGIGSTGFVDLASLNGMNGFVIRGIDSGDRAGRAFSPAGDINGDGIDDVIIAAIAGDPEGNRNAGECYVILGSRVIGDEGVIELESLSNNVGFVLNGNNEQDYCGNAVSSAGDVNADGFDDLLIGAYLADPEGRQNAGECYVVFGSDSIGSSGPIELSSLNGSDGFTIKGIEAGNRFGRDVSSMVDCNGDGISDLLIGSSYPSNPAGECYIIYGSVGIGSSGNFELESLDEDDGFIVVGVNNGDRFGNELSSAGDFNADGFSDILIGAHRADSNGNTDAGAAYVIFGGDNIRDLFAPEDLDKSCSISTADLAILLAAWGTPGGDLNADGTTDSADLAILLAAWTG